MMVGSDKKATVISRTGQMWWGWRGRPPVMSLVHGGDSGISRALFCSDHFGQSENGTFAYRAASPSRLCARREGTAEQRTYRRGTLAHREGEKSDQDLAWFD